jgi:hypothetical protein
VQSRLKRLKRVSALYGVVERMHSSELQRATNAVRETKQAIEIQRSVMRVAGVDVRDALITGDRLGWSLAEMQRELAMGKGKQLEDVRLEREELNGLAQRRYAESRVKSEQMNGVVESLAARIEMKEERRVQGATDDRFLSRKVWAETRGRRGRPK